MNKATLPVHRPAAGFRFSHGRYQIRVDGEVRGELGVGDTVELTVEPGPHELQVGRQVQSLSGITEFGSPVLALDLADGTTTRVKVRPSGVPMNTIRSHPDTMLMLVATDANGVLRTSVLTDSRQPGSLARRRMLTRGLIAKRRPWFSWQAAVSLFVIFFGLWTSVADAFLADRHGIGRWIPAIFFTWLIVTILAQWVSLYRARRATSSP